MSEPAGAEGSAARPARAPRVSLRTRWTVALLLAVLVPLGALSAATVKIQRDGLEAAEKSLEVAVIDHVGAALDDELDAASEAVRRAALALGDARIESDELRLDLAREALARTPVLSHVDVYGPDGAFIDTIARRDAGAGASGAGARRVSTAALEGVDPEGAWLEAEFADRAALLRFAFPLRGGAGPEAQRTGWAVGHVAHAVLVDRVQAISVAHFNRPDRVVVLDDRLRVLVAPGATVAAGGSLAGRDIFRVARVPPGAFHGNFGISTEFSGDDGARMVGTVRTLPARAWAVAVRRPEREAFAALFAARRAFALAAAGMALCAVLLGAYLAARTTRPVRALVELTRAYARREWSRRSDVRTGDELEVLGGSLTDMADELVRSEKELAARQRAEANLSRFLPAEVAQRVAAGGEALALGGERRDVTVLFADVVRFTSFAESAPPERVVAFLNELFTVLSEVVFRHEGTVDKFMGDCLMAIFGAPNAMPDHATRALEAAEDMHRFVEASAPGWLETYGIEVKLGVGVSSGAALVGNLGSEARMEYTAIGDPVNVGARLEALARPGQTLVTGEVARRVGAAFSFNALGEHALRGKSAPVEVLELAS